MTLDKLDAAAIFHSAKLSAAWKMSGTNGVTPTDWVFFETGTAANTTYTVGTGNSTTGNTYSFGSTSSSDRAFGELTSGALSSMIGASFTNGGSTAIQSLNFDEALSARNQEHVFLPKFSA